MNSELIIKMNSNLALVKKTETNGNGLMSTPASKPPVEPLTEEKVNGLLAGRGFRGGKQAGERICRSVTVVADGDENSVRCGPEP